MMGSNNSIMSVKIYQHNVTNPPLLHFFPNVLMKLPVEVRNLPSRNQL